MGSYRYTSVGRTNEYVRLESTDSEMLERILAEAKKFVPSCSVGEKRELPSGELCYYYLIHLRGQDLSVGT